MTSLEAAAERNDEKARRLSIGFINFAHAIDHYVMLILATLVIELTTVYDWSYADLLALGTPSFVAFGLFSLPAGWLGDRWSRRNMIALFFLGCGVSLAVAAFAPNPIVLAVALTALGAFAAIYHPVGTAMLIAQATHRGRSIAFNGVCGNIGVSLAAGITALLVYGFGWRGAFLVPAAVCLVTGLVYPFLVPDERRKGGARSAAPDVALAPWLAATLFGLFALIAVSAGLVFHITSISMPKLVDERIGLHVSLVAVGGLTTLIFLCGAIAQLSIGRIVDKYPLHMLFAASALVQFTGVVWTAYATGPMLIVALTVAICGIYAQVTVNDLVIARYTSDAWRSRVFAVRYFLTFMVSGAAVTLIAVLHKNGGFDLVLSVTAIIAFGFVIGTSLIAVLVNGVEKERTRSAAVPAE